MSNDDQYVVVVLTGGKADNGKRATMAFSCGLSAIAMGRPAAVFLTSDGAVWGYQGSAEGICVQGFPPLEDLISQFTDSGGRINLCSVCHTTCSTGRPGVPPQCAAIDQAEIGGFATVLDLAIGGTTVSF